jgi:hypothetical protein
VDGGRFRDVHDFAVGSHDENETVQSLLGKRKKKIVNLFYFWGY